MNSHTNALAVVMPVYNEEEAVSAVVRKWHGELSRLAIDFRIFAYNDGSKDGTSQILHGLEKTCSRLSVVDKPNSGHGPTILLGYRKAAREFDWILQIDSDDEMGPECFAKLWELRKENDIVVGTRAGRRQPLPRKIVSAVSRGVVRIFYGKTVWDVNTPYRLMRSSAFAKVFQAIPDNTFAPNVAVSGFAAKLKLRYSEVGVAQHDRRTGVVSIRKWKLLKAAVKSTFQTIVISCRKIG